MFCIAAFVIFSILGIFSARYRRLASAAWKCVARRVTFRKCDTDYKEEIKSRLLAKTAAKHPRRARILEKWLGVLAFVFVILMIWSLLVVVKSGLNLYVYNTCNPANAESCSLGSEACSIESAGPSFWTSLKGGHLLRWGHNQVNDFGKTLNALPNRLKSWNPSSYTNGQNTYYNHYDPSKPTALEILDPSCKFCAQLFSNIKTAGVENRYNLSYLVYPIPDSRYPGAYKFPHSYLVASYLEAIKTQPLKGLKVPADWILLERILTWRDPANGNSFQWEINYAGWNNFRVEGLLQKWLKNIGYSDTQAQAIAKAADSQQVKNSIARQRLIVEKQIKTVKIPTLLLDSRRYDGVVSADKLR